MEYRIRCSIVKATFIGQDGQPHTKLIAANEIIAFDHDDPSDDEMQDTLDQRLGLKNPGCIFQYKAVFEKERVK